jgi:hypothetical protein
MMMGATTKTTEPKLVAVDTKDIIKLIKKNKNYTSDSFPEQERYQIYHVIESYPSVKRLLTNLAGAERVALCG